MPDLPVFYSICKKHLHFFTQFVLTHFILTELMNKRINIYIYIYVKDKHYIYITLPWSVWYMCPLYKLELRLKFSVFSNTVMFSFSCQLDTCNLESGEWVVVGRSDHCEEHLPPLPRWQGLLNTNMRAVLALVFRL